MASRAPERRAREVAERAGYELQRRRVCRRGGHARVARRHQGARAAAAPPTRTPAPRSACRARSRCRRRRARRRWRTRRARAQTAPAARRTSRRARRPPRPPRARRRRRRRRSRRRRRRATRGRRRRPSPRRTAARRARAQRGVRDPVRGQIRERVRRLRRGDVQRERQAPRRRRGGVQAGEQSDAAARAARGRGRRRRRREGAIRRRRDHQSEPRVFRRLRAEHACDARGAHGEVDQVRGGAERERRRVGERGDASRQRGETHRAARARRDAPRRRRLGNDTRVRRRVSAARFPPTTPTTEPPPAATTRDAPSASARDAPSASGAVASNSTNETGAVSSSGGERLERPRLERDSRTETRAGKRRARRPVPASSPPSLATAGTSHTMSAPLTTRAGAVANGAPRDPAVSPSRAGRVNAHEKSVRPVSPRKPKNAAERQEPTAVRGAGRAPPRRHRERRRPRSRGAPVRVRIRRALGVQRGEHFDAGDRSRGTRPRTRPSTRKALENRASRRRQRRRSARRRRVPPPPAAPSRSRAAPQARRTSTRRSPRRRAATTTVPNAHAASMPPDMRSGNARAAAGSKLAAPSFSASVFSLGARVRSATARPPPWRLARTRAARWTRGATPGGCRRARARTRRAPRPRPPPVWAWVPSRRRRRRAARASPTPPAWRPAARGSGPARAARTSPRCRRRARACDVSVTSAELAFGSEPATKLRVRANVNAHVAAPPNPSKPQPLRCATAPRRASTAAGATEVTSARLNATRARSAAATVRLGGRKRAGYSDRDASGAIGSGSEQQDDAGSQNSTTTTPPPAPPPGNAGDTHVADSPSAAMVAGDSMTASFTDAPRPNRHTARAPAVSLRVAASPTRVGNRSMRSTPPRKPEPCRDTTSPPRRTPPPA